MSLPRLTGLELRAEKSYTQVDHTDCIGTIGRLGGADFYNRGLDKAMSANGIRHNMKFRVVWELPFGSGQRWLQQGALGQIIGGWQLSVLGTVQSGPPFGVKAANLTESFPAGPSRADILRDPTLPGSGPGIHRRFDTDAFAQPERFKFGTAARVAGRSPGQANFGDPNTSLTSSAFGEINSASARRIVQLGLKLYS